MRIRHTLLAVGTLLLAACSSTADTGPAPLPPPNREDADSSPPAMMEMDASAAMQMEAQ